MGIGNHSTKQERSDWTVRGKTEQVVTFINESSVGGEQVAMSMLAEVLSKTYVVDRIELESLLQPMGLKIFLRTLIKWWWKVLRRKRYQHNQWVITSVHLSVVPLLWLKWRKKAKIVFVYHGNRYLKSAELIHLTLGQKLVFMLSRFMMYLTLNFADKVVIPTNKTDVLKDLGIKYKNKKINFIPNGVNTDRFRPVDKKLLRKKYQINPQMKIITYVGRMNRNKGIIQLIESFAKLDITHKKLLLAYPTPSTKEDESCEKDAEKLITQHHLQDNVIRFFDINRIEEIYQISNLVVMPSREEVFPLVMLESAACGSMFVGTNVGGCQDFLVKVDQRLLLPKKPTIEILNSRLMTLLTLTGKEQQEISRKMRNVALTYDWEKVGLLWQNIVFEGQFS